MQIIRYYHPNFLFIYWVRLMRRSAFLPETIFTRSICLKRADAFVDPNSDKNVETELNWNAGCCALTCVKWGEFTSRSSLRKDILTLRVLNLKNIILFKPEILWYHFRDIKKTRKLTRKRHSEGSSNLWCQQGIQQFLIRGSKLL